MQGILLQAVETTEDGNRRVWTMVLVPNDGAEFDPWTWDDFKHEWKNGTTLGVPTDAETVRRFCQCFHADEKHFYTDHEQVSGGATLVEWALRHSEPSIRALGALGATTDA